MKVRFLVFGTVDEEMRRTCRKLLRVVPCTSKKNLRTDSWKDIEEILKSKLTTIKEEPEICEEKSTSPRLIRRLVKKGKKSSSKDIVRVKFLVPQLSLKESYALFMARFASKQSFGGLLQY